MKSILIAGLLALLAGCASVVPVKVEGEQLVRDRLVVRVSDAWNKIQLPGENAPFDVWTREGLSLDHLRFWVAIRGGQSLVSAPSRTPPAGQKAQRVPTYRAGMPTDEMVGLFELAYAMDGSIVTMGKVEPMRFAGEPGVRFEFSVVRKSDDVQLLGVGWLAVRNDELFAACFVAPRLSFFARLLPSAQDVVRSAAIK